MSVYLKIEINPDVRPQGDLKVTYMFGDREGPYTYWSSDKLPSQDDLKHTFGLLKMWHANTASEAE